MDIFDLREKLEDLIKDIRSLNKEDIYNMRVKAIILTKLEEVEMWLARLVVR